MQVVQRVSEDTLVVTLRMLLPIVWLICLYLTAAFDAKVQTH